MGDLTQFDDPLIREHIEAIKALHAEMCQMHARAPLVMFDSGYHFHQLKAMLDHGEFVRLVEAESPLSIRTVHRHMRFYDECKDVSRDSIAEIASASDYFSAGSRKMIAAIRDESAKRQTADPFAEIRKMKFKGKSLSGLPLKNTRMAWLGDNLVIECAHIGTATKMSICLGPHKDQDPAIYAELRDNLVIAWEVYYYKVEQEQAAGRISYSETTAFPELMKNGKGTIPSVPPSVLGKHRRRPRA